MEQKSAQICLSDNIAAIFQNYPEDFNKLKYGVIELIVRDGQLRAVHKKETYQVDEENKLK